MVCYISSKRGHEPVQTQKFASYIYMELIVAGEITLKSTLKLPKGKPNVNALVGQFFFIKI